MATATLEHVYRYPFQSSINNDHWNFAASKPKSTEAEFFNGRLSHPQITARLLMVLSQIVRTHFFDARPPQMDPIVTSSSKFVRWEGFSGCCGAYVRVDLDERAFDSAEQTFGTTNVDFNPQMIGHLSRIGRDSNVQLSIDQKSVGFEVGGEKVIEKKVPLPRRWIKGLSEVQSYQTRLVRRNTVKPATMTRLLQGMGKTSRGTQYLTVNGVAARLSMRSSTGSIPIGGAERLKALTPLLPYASEIELWNDDESQVFATCLLNEVGRFWMVLSPGLQRGFSGEGQLLATLINNNAHDIADDLYDLLGWQSELHPAELAAKLGCGVVVANDGLNVLSTRGIAGFDATTGYFFHRELPFDLAAVEKDQPRLIAARKIVDAADLRILSSYSDGYDIEVQGTTTKHFVKLRADDQRCTCVWFTKNQGQRGPCKHILAAKLFTEK